MKIGVFTDSYLPAPSGVAFTVEMFRRELTKLGHEVTVFTPEFSGYIDTRPNIVRLPSFITPSRPDTPIIYPLTKSRLQKLEQYEFDIIHTHNFINLGVTGLNLGQKFHIPVVNTHHNLYTDYSTLYAKWLKGIAKSWLLNKCRLYSNSCQGIIVPTPSLKELLIQYNIVVPIEIIPSGIDLQAYTSSPPVTVFNQFHIPKGRKIILYSGPISEESNIRFLLRSFKILLNKIDDIHLVLNGGGPETELFERIISTQSFADNVTLTGLLPKGEANKLIGIADIAVSPSTVDTQGISITEAMAAGVPTIAVNRLGPADIIRDGEDGYLVPLNEDAFAGRIKYLLEHPKLRSHFGLAARKNAARFDIKRCSKHLEQYYSNIIKKNNGKTTQYHKIS